MQLSNTFKKYLSNTSWLFAEKIIRMIVGFSVGVWVTRYLGPERLGIFSYAQSFVFLFSAFATLGLNGIVVRELVKHPEKRDVLLGTSFVLKIVGSFITLGFLSVAIYFSDTERSTAILMLLIGTATVFQAFNVIDFYFQSKVLSKYVVFAQAGAMVVVNSIKVTLILASAPLIWFAGVLVLEASLISVGLIGYYLKSGTHISDWVIDWKVGRELLKDSWPLIIAGIASSINMRLDQVFLGTLSSKIVVGNYSAAVKFAEVWLILPVVIGSSIYPMVIEAYKKGPEVYQTLVFSIIRRMSYFAVPFALTISLSSNFIVSFLYGSEFSDASKYLSIYIWTGLPYVLFFVINQVLLIENLTKWSFYITLLAIVSNITLNYLLIPKYQGLGAVFTTLIIAYSAQFLSILVVYTKTKIFKTKELRA